jgi:hypothetical protein
VKSIRPALEYLEVQVHFGRGLEDQRIGHLRVGNIQKKTPAVNEASGPTGRRRADPCLFPPVQPAAAQRLPGENFLGAAIKNS